MHVLLKWVMYNIPEETDDSRSIESFVNHNKNAVGMFRDQRRGEKSSDPHRTHTIRDDFQGG